MNLFVVIYMAFDYIAQKVVFIKYWFFNSFSCIYNLFSKFKYIFDCRIVVIVLSHISCKYFKISSLLVHSISTIYVFRRFWVMIVLSVWFVMFDLCDVCLFVCACVFVFVLYMCCLCINVR